MTTALTVAADALATALTAAGMTAARKDNEFTLTAEHGATIRARVEADLHIEVDENFRTQAWHDDNDPVYIVTGHDFTGAYIADTLGRLYRANDAVTHIADVAARLDAIAGYTV